jgi:hypothetical protein
MRCSALTVLSATCSRSLSFFFSLSFSLSFCISFCISFSLSFPCSCSFSLTTTTEEDWLLGSVDEADALETARDLCCSNLSNSACTLEGSVGDKMLGSP